MDEPEGKKKGPQWGTWQTLWKVRGLGEDEDELKISPV